MRRKLFHSNTDHNQIIRADEEGSTEINGQGIQRDKTDRIGHKLTMIRHRQIGKPGSRGQTDIHAYRITDRLADRKKRRPENATMNRYRQTNQPITKRTLSINSSMMSSRCATEDLEGSTSGSKATKKLKVIEVLAGSFTSIPGNAKRKDSKNTDLS